MLKSNHSKHNSEYFRFHSACQQWYQNSQYSCPSPIFWQRFHGIIINPNVMLHKLISKKKTILWYKMSRIKYKAYIEKLHCNSSNITVIALSR